MNFDLIQVALLCFTYMLVLFGIAYTTEKGWIPNSIVRHPITYVLSLGVFFSAWEFYGIVELAYNFGYGALAYYLGMGALFLFAPVALTPLTEIARRYQINSLADLFVFRYHNHAIGTLATLCMCLAVVPLLGLQLQAIADTLSLLTLNNSENTNNATQLQSLSLEKAGLTHREAIAFIYCLILAAFTILFGSTRERHRGLVTAMAFESLIKIFALCSIGLFSLFGVFGGLEGLDDWLADNPEKLSQLYSPIGEPASHTLLLVFISAAVAMPHIFHMSIVENSTKNRLSMLSWAFPLFLLFIAIPIFPILWAGLELKIPFSTQYFTLGVPMHANSPTLTIIAFIGGLSAATGVQVAIALALSTMILNHWLLPVLQLNTKRNVYRQLLWLRRALILVIFIGGFLFFLLVHNQYSLTNLALLAFIEGLQFLPGIISIAYWSRANSRGFIAGLSAGTLVWIFGLFFPAIFEMTEFSFFNILPSMPIGFSVWHYVTLIALTINVIIFISVSLLTATSIEEKYSAELCSADEISHPIRNTLDISSTQEFKNRLQEKLGQTISENEVNRALKELGLHHNERRPYALRRLRDKLEANLSGLFGVSIASEIIDEYIPYKIPTTSGNADITLIENLFAGNNHKLTGIAAELNNLRLYHRKTLQELPMAICSLGPDLEILMWNKAMETLTHIKGEDVTGSHLKNLKEPWQSLIFDFTKEKNNHSHNHSLMINDSNYWFSLHKASIEGPVATSADGQVIMIEDVTEIQQLEKELLHSERLASVGRLAAGVAHEIGNPVTGIACLAQNIQYESKNTEVLDTAKQILSQTDRITQIVQSLVSFSHAGSETSDQFDSVDMKTCANEAIQLLSLQKEKNHVNFINKINDELILSGNQQRIIQVFVNLLSNARDASENNSDVLITGVKQDDWVTIQVIDDGHGIAKSDIGRILDPFYTTKEPGEGTGLGLSMVYSIVSDHHGQIDIQSPSNESSGRGSCFTLQFPLIQPIENS
ncbi:MAG: GHKL domain-containing protein [Cellvibrionaceae bacterium]